MKRSKNLHIALVALTSLATMSFTGCKDQPDEYKSTSGKPEVQYIRLPQSADSIITKSYLQYAWLERTFAVYIRSCSMISRLC